MSTTLYEVSICTDNRFCWGGGAPQPQTQHLERPSFERRSHSTTSLDAYFQAASTAGGTPHGERPGSGSYFSVTPSQSQPQSSHSHSHSMSSTPSESYFSTSSRGGNSQGSSSSGESAMGLDFSGAQGGGGLELNTRGTMSPPMARSPSAVY